MHDGHKTQILRLIREILRTSNLFLGVIGGLTTGPLPLNRADTGRYRLRPYKFVPIHDAFLESGCHMTVSFSKLSERDTPKPGPRRLLYARSVKLTHRCGYGGVRYVSNLTVMAPPSTPLSTDMLLSAVGVEYSP